MIKKLLKILVNKPRVGSIIETINPILSVGLFLTSIFCIYIGSTVEELDPLVSMTFMLFGIIFAWQVGWGMQIRRFEKSEKKKMPDTHTLPTLSGDFDGDPLDMSKIISEMSNKELLKASEKLKDIEPGHYDDYFIPLDPSKIEDYTKIKSSMIDPISLDFINTKGSNATTINAINQEYEKNISQMIYEDRESNGCQCEDCKKLFGNQYFRIGSYYKNKSNPIIIKIAGSIEDIYNTERLVAQYPNGDICIIPNINVLAYWEEISKEEFDCSLDV